MPKNDDKVLGDQFDLCLRGMMDKINSELQQNKGGGMKSRAAILAKREML